MTIRGGGDPRQAWLRRRPREWACRPGAAPPMRITASWSRSVGPTEYKCVARVRVHHGELPSDREITLDRTNPIQACPGEGRGDVSDPQLVRAGCLEVALHQIRRGSGAVSYTHLRAHETPEHLV